MAEQSEKTKVTAGEVADAVGGRIIGDPATAISGPCHLDRPQPGKLCFLNSLDDLKADPTTSGAVAIGPPGVEQVIWGTAIVVDQPRLAFARIVQKYFSPVRVPRIAASAHIDDSAKIGENVSIGEGCVIEEGVSIGTGTELRHNVVLGPNVRVGESCVIGSNTVIGEVGFGLAKDEAGANLRIPHLGSVVIGNEVEIGALTSIAAGTIEPTLIRDRAKIDDHVFIAHNCDLGEDVMVIACAEISGSVRIGRGTWIGPNVAIRDRLTIAPDSLIGIGSTVVKSLEEPGVYAGSPARLMRRNSESPTPSDQSNG